MLGFYLATPTLSLDGLKKFVQEHMLSPADIVAAAKAQALPDTCDICGVTLEECAGVYNQIPSVDKQI